MMVPMIAPIWLKAPRPQPCEHEADQAEEGRLGGGEIENGFVDEKEIGVEVVDDHHEHEARQPCGVGFPFEPCEPVGHGLGGHQEFHDAIEAAAMNLPGLAANAFRQVVVVLQAEIEMDEIE
jgi:hypothetical protein